MKVIYNNKEIPIVEKRKGKEDQIVFSKTESGLKYRIILSNETCIGSVKPLVSITNQILKKIEYKSFSTKDFLHKDLTYSRILTIKI